MMEENNHIFLAGSDALVHLVEPMQKKYSTKFTWGGPFSMYVSYDRFLNSSPPTRTCAHFRWPPPLPQLRIALL